MHKKLNQKGISLLEMILTIAIIALIATGMIILIAKQTDNVKNLLTSTKMTNLVEAAGDYVTDNFGKVQDQLNTVKTNNQVSGVNQHQASSDINGDGIIDNNDTITIAAIEITINDLKNDGYLRNSFQETTPWKTTLKVGASFVGKENVIQIVVFNTNSDDITIVNKNDIVAGIKDGMGAMWYDIDSTLNFCSKITEADGSQTSQNCIRGLYSNWEMKNPKVVFNGVFTPIPLSTDVIPLAVKFIDGERIDRNALNKSHVANHPEVSFVDSDLNFMPDEIDALDGNNQPIVQKEQGIFFNAMKNRDLNADGLNDFSGSNLTYKQEFADRNNDGIEEAITKAVLSVNNNAGGVTPYFSAEGGVITDLEKTIGDSCVFDSASIYSDFGLMARDSNGTLLKCISNQDTNNPTAGTWKEFGDVNYVNTIDIDLPVPTSDDTDFEFYDARLENASAVIVQLDNAQVAHTNGTETKASLQFRDKISDRYRSLLDVEIPSTEANGNYSFTGQGIFPVKEGRVIYKKIGDVSSKITPAGPVYDPNNMATQTYTITPYVGSSSQHDLSMDNSKKIRIFMDYFGDSDGAACRHWFYSRHYPQCFNILSGSGTISNFSFNTSAGVETAELTYTPVASAENVRIVYWDTFEKANGDEEVRTRIINLDISDIYNNNPGGGAGGNSIGAKIIGYIE